MKPGLFKIRVRWRWLKRRVIWHWPMALAITDDQGVTSLEWTLLLAAIALPSYFIIRIALLALIGHYHMVTTLNSLPFP